VNQVLLFLDSGAFSADSKNTKINLDDYMAFIFDNKDYIEVYANLDVIGDPVATWRNQKIMEDAGLTPLPVFHTEDDIKYLHRCLDYEYFCLGGMASGYTTDQRREFLDMCFKIICNTPNHLPASKVHGFGMTSLQLMLRYPWWSVDSTSWVMTSRMGFVYIPKYREGKYTYLADPWKIAVSDRSPSRKDEGEHFKTLSPGEQSIILRYITEQGFSIGISEYREEDRNTYKLQEGERWFGKEEADAQRSIKGGGDNDTFVLWGTGKDNIVETVIEPGLCNDYKLRDEMNIIYYKNLEKEIPEWPWPFKLAKQRRTFGLV
jgi:hypothetical protein